MRALVLLLVLLPSCFQASAGHGGSDAGASSTSTANDAATGIGCAQEPGTNVTLCLGISKCPADTIDEGAFPNCGFRETGGSAIDLECVCNGYLCPIGVATSCAGVQALLSEQNELSVCGQVNEDRCPALTPVTPPASSCDKDCEAQCAGVPDCYVACGC